MHSVVETKVFQRQAANAGMTEEEVDLLISYLSANPAAGDEMAGTGGCRKVRVAGRGKGKSGGYRTITFYSGTDIPVFLIAAFSKGERTNLSKKEQNGLARLTKILTSEYANKVVSVPRARGNKTA
jgi:hypothetical protein